MDAPSITIRDDDPAKQALYYSRFANVSLRYCLDCDTALVSGNLSRRGVQAALYDPGDDIDLRSVHIPNRAWHNATVDPVY